MSVAKKHQNDVWDLNAIVELVSDIVSKESGNVLQENQKSMVLNRIRKRFIDLGGLSPNQYHEYLTSNYKDESSYLISLLTTHHTFFFREFIHFEYIIKNLSTFVENVKARGESKIKIFSAACSRGQEVYSLSMLLNHHLKDYPEISYEILGSDIDPKSVAIAKNGVYPYKEVKSIPQMYLSGNWQKGTGEIADFAKIKKELKTNCRFEVMNLFDLEKHLGAQQFDIIFCRNVFIYFEMQDVEKITNVFKKYLYKDGIFFTGLSESLHTLPIKKKTLSPSVYSFNIDVSEDKPRESAVVKNDIVSLIPEKIRVLAVDDSNSILKLLTKIFKEDPQFELVGTASNGLEAQEFLKHTQVDALTLDIHMPEMDGVEYLKKNFNSSHPNVIILSSASREDARYAQETLKYGASDFIEKPALNNLEQRADEIKNKIKMSFLNKKVQNTTHTDEIVKSFLIENIESKARFVFANFSDKAKIESYLKDLQGKQPATFIFFEGNGNFLDVIKGELKSSQEINLFSDNTSIQDSSIYLCDFNNDFESVKNKFELSSISSVIFGIASKKLEDILFQNNFGQVLLEDTKEINKSLKEVVSDIFPWTSFSHVSTEFLAKVAKK